MKDFVREEACETAGHEVASATQTPKWSSCTLVIAGQLVPTFLSLSDQCRLFLVLTHSAKSARDYPVREETITFVRLFPRLLGL